MAKNIKWIKVDSVTGVSEATTQAKNGAVNPNLSGLVETFDWGQYKYGTADDSVTVDPSNHIHEITDAEYITDISGKIAAFVREWKTVVYEQEIELRKKELGTYADSVYASAAGYKYDAAVAFISSATPNAGLTTEAFYRGCTVSTLANKIKTNHEAFVTKEAKIAGVRGLLYDRICSIGINTTSVSTALASYAGIHTNEIIGTATTSEVPFYQPYGMESRLRIL